MPQSQTAYPWHRVEKTQNTDSHNTIKPNLKRPTQQPKIDNGLVQMTNVGMC